MADDASHTPDPSVTPAESPPDTAPTDASTPPRRRRRPASTTRDLTKGSVPKNLWFLAWPQIAEGFLGAVDQIADLIWAGRLGFQAIAGLGVAQTYILMLMTARMGLDAGMRSMIARAVGARQIAYANHVLLQSLTLTTVFVVVVVVVGLLLTEPMLRVIGLSDAIVTQAAAYMRIQFLSMGVMSYQRVSGGALQASGDSVTPLKAAAVTRVTHLALSPVLIFGVWWFPDMGLAGAAMANLVAQLLGVSLNFFALARGGSRIQLSLKGYYVDFDLNWRLLRLGAPAAVTGMQRALSQLMVIGIVAPFGDTAVAAFALTRRAENVVNQGSRGLGRAAGALAGQNLGAGQPARAKASVMWAIIYVAMASLSLAAVFLLAPNAVASFFASDAEFVSQAAKWLSIMAIGYFSMNAVQVFTQSLNTSGATFAPMVITLSTVWLVDVPLAFTLSNFTSLDELGVPWALVAGMTLRLVVFGWYFSRGSWLRTGVI